jgi:hypothetical protein
LDGDGGIVARGGGESKVRGPESGQGIHSAGRPQRRRHDAPGAVR